MSSKQSVLMAQVNYRYGDNVFVPYSVGSIQAYTQTHPEIRESFQFARPLFLRTDPVEVVKRIEEPAVVCFSSYLWNWEYNITLAKMLRAAFPDCLIVFGGTHVPDNSEGFFVDHPYIDILVHQEGELAFSEILRQLLLPGCDFTKIPGLSVRVEGNQTFKTGPSIRIKDLSVLPSPYLAGIFDFMLDQGFLLNVSQETNRGCPYSCTFCDWGGNTYAKLFCLDEGRLLEEFEWFGRNQVEYLFNCDANYGIFTRDLDLTEQMITIRERYSGFPRRFRMCTAKNSNQAIFTIAKRLNDVGMSKGATLSFQSLDPHTLEVVKRKNIRIEVFKDLMRQYRDERIPSYTELIMGMPGETYASTKEGVDALIDGQDDNVNIYAYVCTALPNSEMSSPDYVKAHSLKTVRMPIFLAHSTPAPESLPEYQDVVVETETMSNEDWQRAYLFYWAVQAFHCLGLLQHIAILFRKEFGIRYSDFYESLINYFTDHQDTLVGKQISLVREVVAGSMTGGSLDLIRPQFGDICWPLEEVSFLDLMADKNIFYREVRVFIEMLACESGQTIETDLLDDVVLYESSMIKDPDHAQMSIELRYDLHDYFSRLGDSISLQNTPTRLLIKGDQHFAGNREEYARVIVWYGRKGGRFHYSNVTNESL